MVNEPLYIALGATYIAENTGTMGDPKLFAFLRQENDPTGCGVELFVIRQRRSEEDYSMG